MTTTAAATFTPATWLFAYLDGDPEVSSFYAGVPFDLKDAVALRPPGAWTPLSGEEVAEWKAFLAEHGGGAATVALVDALADGATLAVVTGQQAGAALGPLYTIHKAISAVAWARRIEEQTGRRCVPIFWVASDDHDIAEIAPVRWLTAGDDVMESGLAGAPAPGRAAFATSIDPESARTFLDQFEATTRETEFRAPLLDDLRGALLADGATFESQFVRLFLKWLAPLGIVPVVPRLDFLRKRGAPVMEAALSRAAEVSASLLEAGARMEALGLAAPIHRSGGEVNAFLFINGVRAKLVREGESVQCLAPGVKEPIAEFSTAELQARLASAPEDFSPNVVTRPLVQDAALPTVAYVGGPGEFAYHGQIGGLYELLGVPRPALLPRPSMLLLEPPAERSIARLGLAPAELAAHSAGSLRELAQAGAVGDIRASLASRLEALRGEIAAVGKVIEPLEKDTGVSKAARKLADSVDAGARVLEERVAQFLLTQDDARAGALARVLAHAFPGGHPQERHLNALAPLLVNHGTEVFEGLLEALLPEWRGVQVVGLLGTRG